VADTDDGTRFPGQSEGVSERTFAFRPRLLTGLLRPVLFGLAIAAGVLAGDRSGSFWVGLLAFMVASGTGRSLRRLLRGRVADAVYELLWPAAATGIAILFIEIGLAEWASAVLAIVLAGLVKNALASAFLPRRVEGRWLRPEEWGLPGMEDVIEGRSTEKENV
jgi:hypothetical protein